MYRVRAAAVSGTKVFAGGKWLTCIGNKRVRVGEYVWTDGRCVYGNNRVLQQPLVIIAPKKKEVEGIPIIMAPYTELGWNIGGGMYSYTRRGLEEISFDDESQNPYKSTQGMLINDKREVFAAANLLQKTEGQNHSVLLAANIDDYGNRYDLLHYYTDDDAKILIVKNGVTVNKFSLDALITQTQNACPEPSTSPNPPPGDYFIPNPFVEVMIDSAFGGCFIENENNWYLFFLVSVKKNGYADDWTIVESISYDEYFYIANGKANSIFTTSQIGRHNRVTGITYEITTINHANDFKIPLHDGFYCTMTKMTEPFNARYTRDKGGFVVDGSFDEEASVRNTLFYRDFFSSDGEKICRGITPIATRNVLAEVRDGYLLSTIYNVGLLKSGFYSNESELTDNDFGYGGGLFLVQGEDISKIADGFCINQRLITLKNCKNWQDKIYTLEMPELTF